MIKLLVTAISITTKDYGQWTKPVQKLFLQHCAWHKKFHENVIKCKKVGDQITSDRFNRYAQICMI